MFKPQKTYGLYVPKRRVEKEAQIQSNKTTIFDGNESDEESSSFLNKSVKARYTDSITQTKVKQQTQIEIDKALKEDATIFQYDEIYDEIQDDKPSTQIRREKEALKNSAQARKPKYIEGLLKAAKKRNQEFELREERKVQREREAEGDQFADKEKFVTSSYRKKMEELQAAEEEERRKGKDDDVTKESDMSKFYRGILEQRTARRTDVKPKIEEPKPNSSPDSSSEQKPTEETLLAEASNARKVSDDRRRSPKRRNSPDRSRRSRSHESRRDGKLSSNQHRRQERSGDDRHMRNRSGNEDKKRRRSTDLDDVKSSERRDSQREPRESQHDCKERRASQRERTISGQSDVSAKRRRSSSGSARQEIQKDPYHVICPIAPAPPEPDVKAIAAKFAKKTTEERAAEAKARYLARRADPVKAKPVIVDSDSD